MRAQIDIRGLTQGSVQVEFDILPGTPSRRLPRAMHYTYSTGMAHMNSDVFASFQSCALELRVETNSINRLEHFEGCLTMCAITEIRPTPMQLRERLHQAVLVPAPHSSQDGGMPPLNV